MGCAYNLLSDHESLRPPAREGTGRKWVERPPPMVAGLTEHKWAVLEFLSYQVREPFLGRSRTARTAVQAQLRETEMAVAVRPRLNAAVPFLP